MAKENKKTRMPEPKKEISPERARALELAFSATRLLEDKYFDSISKAIKEKDWVLFEKTCEDADISPEVAKLLWRITASELPQEPSRPKAELLASVPTPIW